MTVPGRNRRLIHALIFEKDAREVSRVLPRQKRRSRGSQRPVRTAVAFLHPSSHIYSLAPNLSCFRSSIERAKSQCSSAALEKAMATPSSAPLNDSVSARRKRQRVENYHSGRARSAYCFKQSLNDGFAASSSSQEGGNRPCKRHCSQALGKLKEAFVAVSKHPAKVLQKRMASYPTPKKPRLAHQNFTGNITHNKTPIFINTQK